MKRFRGGAATCLLTARLAAPLAAEPPPDRIYVNGRIWTGEDSRPRAEAVAIRGERIVAVGKNREIKKLGRSETGVVDLKGRFMAPGFIDAHLHFLVLETVDLAEAGSLEEAQRRIAAYAQAHPELPWVAGRGWAYSVFPGGLPHKKWLDAVVPDRPAWMLGYDGHTGWCNSKALDVAGVTKDTLDPENGVIVRDENGEPTGCLKEAAMGLVRQFIPPPTDEDRYQALKRRLDQAASYGLTSVHQASFPEVEIPVFERVLAEGGPKVRFYWVVPFVKDVTPEDMTRFKALRDKFRGPVLKFGGAKGMVDGVVESKTAAMFEPYEGGGNGEPRWTADELNRTAVLYDREGFQIFLHAIGDKAIHMALDAFEYAAQTNGTSGRRHRVEHIEVPALDDLPRFRALGVMASTQALFANPDANTLEVYAVNLGPARAARAMPFKLLDEAGAVQAFGSDWPVTSMEVLKGIYCAVTRQTPAGTPKGGWQPHLRISAEAALRHFTRDAAYAGFDEDLKGTLGPGKLADFVVLSRDILEGPPEKILETKVLLTVMGGRETYRDKEF